VAFRKHFILHTRSPFKDLDIAGSKVVNDDEGLKGCQQFVAAAEVIVIVQALEDLELRGFGIALDENRWSALDARLKHSKNGVLRDS
jgi:hypothetical protein